MHEHVATLKEGIEQLIDIRSAGKAKPENWDILYDLTFAHWQKVVKPCIEELGIEFEWHDPDTTPEADVCALVDALERDVLPVVKDLCQRFFIRKNPSYGTN